ncbi:MAG TPA: TetR family transcriptional regulator, partial [Pseudomonadota bacterium]|nr:TetR family transcriptional regulator [Pseudomonadota bacterium]
MRRPSLKAEAAGVARRTLYNQFASKEEIFREMLLRVSGQIERGYSAHSMRATFIT